MKNTKGGRHMKKLLNVRNDTLSRLEQRFAGFHKANPQTYERIKQYALEACLSNVPKVSMTMVVERIKWASLVETEAAAPFVLNKDYYAAYVRMFVREYPKHADRFELRSSGFGR